MKNKKTLILSFTVGILVIILIVILVLIKVRVNNNNNSDKNNSNNSVAKPAEPVENEKEKPVGLITCTLTNDSSEYYQVNEIIEITLKNENIQEITNREEIIYKDKDNYNGFKENEKQENATFDDENLTITINNPLKLTTEELSQMDYQELINTYEEQNYKCQNK